MPQPRVLSVVCATALMFGLVGCSGGDADSTDASASNQTKEEACVIIEEGNTAAEEASTELVNGEIDENSSASYALSATMDVFLERADEVTEAETKALLTEVSDGVDAMYETAGDLTLAELQEDAEALTAYSEEFTAVSESLEALYSHCGIATTAETAE